MPRRSSNTPIHFPMTERLSVGVNEAAAMLGISRAKLYREAQAGRLKLRKAGGRTLVRVDDAKAWLEACA